MTQYQIEIIETSAQPALVIRGKAKLELVGNAIGEILEKIEKYLDNKSINPAGAPFTRTYHIENGMIEFESGFPVAETLTGQGEIISTELPKGKVATTIHLGSQQTSEQAYAAIHVWVEKNNKKVAGAPWEVYLSDPSSTPENESKLQIFFPVK